MPDLTIYLEVRDVLQQAHFAPDYVRLHMTINSKLYNRVNEVMEKVGGVWNKSAKRHDFAVGEPRELLGPILWPEQYHVKNVQELKVYSVVGLLTNGERFCHPFTVESKTEAVTKAHQLVNGKGLVNPDRMLLVAAVVVGVHKNLLPDHILSHQNASFA